MQILYFRTNLLWFGYACGYSISEKDGDSVEHDSNFFVNVEKNRISDKKVNKNIRAEQSGN
jgi:hypothetical protein